MYVLMRRLRQERGGLIALEYASTEDASGPRQVVYVSKETAAQHQPGEIVDVLPESDL